MNSSSIGDYIGLYKKRTMIMYHRPNNIGLTVIGLYNDIPNKHTDVLRTSEMVR